MIIATQNLENDHVNILRLTDVMEQMTNVETTNVNHLKSVVNIIRNYADGLHHKKEEDLLFPFFEQRGAGGGCGPVGVMLMEHEQGREFVKGMMDNIDLCEKGDQGAMNLVYQNMLGYAGLLRDHIYKENNILFRMAENTFSEDDQNMLLDKFGKIESSAEEGSKIEDYVVAIDELAQAYSL